MSKEFLNFSILDVRNLLENTVGKEDIDRYKLRLINRRNKGIYIFSPKDFRRFKAEHNVSVVGNIHKRQRRYKDYEDLTELKANKFKKNIIGRCRLSFDTPDNAGSECKNYDMHEPSSGHTYGYAWVGEFYFVRVRTFNCLWLLLPVLLAALLALFLGDDTPEQDYGEKIVDEVKENGYKVMYVDINGYDANTFHLSEDKRTLQLIHLDTKQNKDFLLKYTVSYKGKEIYSTGLIKSGNAVNADIYDALPKGRSKLNLQIIVFHAKTHKPTGFVYTEIANVIKK